MKMNKCDTLTCVTLLIGVAAALIATANSAAREAILSLGKDAHLEGVPAQVLSLLPGVALLIPRCLFALGASVLHAIDCGRTANSESRLWRRTLGNLNAELITPQANAQPPRAISA